MAFVIDLSPASWGRGSDCALLMLGLVLLELRMSALDAGLCIRVAAALH